MSVWQVETYRPGTANSLVCYRGTDEAVARRTYESAAEFFRGIQNPGYAVMLRENGTAVRNSRNEGEKA